MRTSGIKLLCIILLALFVQCEREVFTSSPEQNTPVFLVPMGTLTGRIIPIDTAGVRLGDKSGILVTVEQTSCSGTTDYTGFVSIGDLPAGTYTISVRKPGFGELRLDNFKFVPEIPNTLGKVFLDQNRLGS